MRNMRLNEAFQYVDDMILDIVKQEKRKKKKKSVWRVVAIVVVCICILLLPAGVMVDRLFELRNLLLQKKDNEEDRYLSFEERSFNLSEASFVFPDVREDNVSIGKFKEIYFMDYTDVSKDGSADVIVIAVYEKDGNEYYDTRVYEEREKGFVVNVALTQELNEKYYNVDDYPVWDIVTAPGE